MQSLFYAFCVVCVVIWLIGWGVLIAEWRLQKKEWKFSRWLRNMTTEYGRKLLGLIVMLIVSGCATTGPVEIKRTCPPMLRVAVYNAMQGDELADYRIAVEQCTGGIK